MNVKETERVCATCGQLDVRAPDGTCITLHRPGCEYEQNPHLVKWRPITALQAENLRAQWEVR